MKTFNKLIYILPLALLLGLASCQKNLEVAAEGGANAISPDNAIKTSTDLQNLLNSCYDACANMMNGRFQIAGDLLADDVTSPLNSEPFRTAVYNHQIDQFNSFVGDVFAQPYYTIYRCNVMDLYYDQVKDLSAANKQRMQGEAAFLRAMGHWELVKLYAQPAGYTSDNSHPGVMLRTRAQNEPLARSSVAETYKLVISDLQNAIGKLPASNGNYANMYSAKALLAKVYFQMGDYNNALTQLNDVIGSNKYTLSDSLNRYRRSEVESETIFGFVAGDNAYETGSRSSEFKTYYRSDLGKPQMGLSPQLYALISDTIGNPGHDKRMGLITLFDAGTPTQLAATNKFNQTLFASTYLTLTDMILMRAEIRAMQGDATGALADITLIINRAYENPAAALAGITPQNMLDAIRQQRRFEMMCEGDRVQQIKRIGVLKGKGNVFSRTVPWECNGMVLQFPSSCGTSHLFVFNPTATCN